jgi:hypothetical protein
MTERANSLAGVMIGTYGRGDAECNDYPTLAADVLGLSQDG